MVNGFCLSHYIEFNIASANPKLQKNFTKFHRTPFYRTSSDDCLCLIQDYHQWQAPKGWVMLCLENLKFFNSKGYQLMEKDALFFAVY